MQINKQSLFFANALRMEKLTEWLKPNLTWLKQNKWLVAGLAIAILNPLPSGVILGIVLLTEEKLVKTGRIILAVSVILVVVLTLLVFFTPRR